MLGAENIHHTNEAKLEKIDTHYIQLMGVIHHLSQSTPSPLDILYFRHEKTIDFIESRVVAGLDVTPLNTRSFLSFQRLHNVPYKMHVNISFFFGQ